MAISGRMFVCTFITAVLAVVVGLLASVDMSAGNKNPGTSLGSGAMFDAIAKNYDATNAIISLGSDVAWRAELVKALGLEAGDRVLDLATGTADVAIALARSRARPELVVGVDPSPRMLGLGREKVAKAGLGARVELVEGDAQDLAGFGDGHFDRASMSFGIRNVPDRGKALRELGRVVKGGGRICVLEFSEPTEGILAPLARLFVRHVVPRVGALLSGGAAAEYAHLQRSIETFPGAAGFRAEMDAAGLLGVESRLLHLGGVYLYTAAAPKKGI